MFLCSAFWCRQTSLVWPRSLVVEYLSLVVEYLSLVLEYLSQF
jgi:hypothetical protein